MEQRKSVTVKSLTDTAMDLMGYTGENGNERFTRRIMNKLIPIVNAVYTDIWHIEMTPNNLMEYFAVYDPDLFKELRNTKPRERLVRLEEMCVFRPVENLQSMISLRQIALDAMTYGIAAFLAQSEDDSDNQTLWMGIYNKKRAGLTHNYRVHDVVPHVLEDRADVNLPYPF